MCSGVTLYYKDARRQLVPRQVPVSLAQAPPEPGSALWTEEPLGKGFDPLHRDRFASWKGAFHNGVLSASSTNGTWLTPSPRTNRPIDQHRPRRGFSVRPPWRMDRARRCLQFPWRLRFSWLLPTAGRFESALHGFTSYGLTKPDGPEAELFQFRSRFLHLGSRKVLELCRPDCNGPELYR